MENRCFSPRRKPRSLERLWWIWFWSRSFEDATYDTPTLHTRACTANDTNDNLQDSKCGDAIISSNSSNAKPESINTYDGHAIISFHTNGDAILSVNACDANPESINTYESNDGHAIISFHANGDAVLSINSCFGGNRDRSNDPRPGDAKCACHTSSSNTCWCSRSSWHTDDQDWGQRRQRWRWRCR